MTKYKNKHKPFNPSALVFALHQLSFSNEGLAGNLSSKKQRCTLTFAQTQTHLPTYLIKFLNSSCLREGKLFHPYFQGCHF